jgi:hypothetical protein
VAVDRAIEREEMSDGKQEVYSGCHPDEDERSGEKMWIVLFGALGDKA